MSSRREKNQPATSATTEPFSLRWHAIANPATPSADIMSSPDPLNDDTLAALAATPSSSQRVTRSQRSDRFVSLASSRASSRAGSPRKQTFELEVGHSNSKSRSPQRLLVTVETEDGLQQQPSSTTSRRLFPSPSPFSPSGAARSGTTTTVVPLKDSIEEEYGDEPGPGQSTPSRRARPRRTNGTPIPAAARKRRAPTPPVRRTPKRANTWRDPDPLSDLGPEASPTPRRRGRSATKSATPDLLAAMSGDVDIGSDPLSETTPVPTPTPKRRRGPPKSPSAAPPSDMDTASTPVQEQQPAPQPSPTPRRSGRSRGSQAAEPSSASRTASSATKAASARRGRRRRHAVGPDGLEGIAEAPPDPPTLQPTPSASENEMDLVEPPRPPAQGPELAPGPTPAPDEPQSDIWMATMSNEATPRPDTRTTQPPPDRPEGQDPQHSPSAAVESVASEAEGYGDGAPSASDLSSLAGDPQLDTVHRNNTVAQEDFSMIFMDSIPSFQDFKSSVPGAQHRQDDDLGDDTNRIINDTLESLRQSVGQERREQERSAEVSGEPSGEVPEEPQHGGDFPLESAGEEEAMDLLEPQQPDDELLAGEDVPQDAQSMHVQEPEPQEAQQVVELGDAEFDDEELEVPELRIPEESQEPELPRPIDMEELRRHLPPHWETAEEAPAQSTSPPAAAQPDQQASSESAPAMSSAAWSSRSHRAFSPSLARSPFKANVSPLRRRALNSAVRNTEAAPQAADSHPRVSPRMAEDESNSYEDSFSEIPQEILEAATPRRPAMESVPLDELEEEDDEAGEAEYLGDLEQEAEASQLVEEPEQGEQLPDAPEVAGHVEPATSRGTGTQETAQPIPSSASSRATTDNGRLPTPDDTPPNIEVDADESPDKTHHHSSPPDPTAQLTSEHNAASPEEHRVRSRQAAAFDSRASSTRDATPLHQISSPAQEPASAGGSVMSDKAPRPALSAIVRAGRVLQNITSDPPSPEHGDRQLGSPFRSSASKESWSGSRESQRNPSSASPGRRSASQQRRSASIDRRSQDPFGSATRNTGQGSFMEALGNVARDSAGRSQKSPASSMRVTPPDEEMSWVAEAGPISPRLRGDVSLDEAARTASATGALLGEQPSPRAPEAEPVGDAPEDMSEDEPAPEPGDDETDIWELEAQREEPEPSPQQPILGANAPAPLHRRSALPSPWTRNTGVRGRVASSSRPSERPSGVAARGEQSNAEGDSEEYSLLAQRQQQTQAAEADKAAESAKANRLDLSSFFSSPAAIPGMLAEKFFPSRKAAGPGRSSAEKPAAAPPAVPTSTMFPAVQEEMTEVRRRPRAAAAAPPKPARSRQQDSVDHGSASPDTPEQLRMAMSAQRTSFTPRPRQTNMSFFQSSPRAPSAGPSAATTTPPRMQLSRADIRRWQQGTTSASDDSPPRAFLRPLPPRNASPTKSSMRSPLKPHTPGRVVEFTSSVLSPLEQARQRRQPPDRPLVIASEQQQQQQPPPADGGEDQQGSDVSMPDAAVPDPPEGLSQTTWTRQHWLLMDRLLRHRRAGPFAVEVERRADGLLGKTIRSHGESLVLERWHLDCVDAFRAVVGGWDEAALAKRLFALVVGEEKRRRLGATATTTAAPAAPAASRTSRVMFH